MSLNIKKRFKQEQGEDFSQWKVSSQTMVTSSAYRHNYLQNIRETSLSTLPQDSIYGFTIPRQQKSPSL